MRNSLCGGVFLMWLAAVNPAYAETVPALEGCEDFSGIYHVKGAPEGFNMRIVQTGCERVEVSGMKESGLSALFKSADADQDERVVRVFLPQDPSRPRVLAKKCLGDPSGPAGKPCGLSMMGLDTWNKANPKELIRSVAMMADYTNWADATLMKEVTRFQDKDRNVLQVTQFFVSSDENIAEPYMKRSESIAERVK